MIEIRDVEKRTVARDARQDRFFCREDAFSPLEHLETERTTYVNLVVNYPGTNYLENFVVNYSDLVHDKVHEVVFRSCSRQGSRDSCVLG